MPLHRSVDLDFPPLAEQYAVVRRHFLDMIEHYGREGGVRMARKHIGWYTKGISGSAEFRNRVNQEPDPDRVKAMLAEFYAPYRMRDAA